MSTLREQIQSYVNTWKHETGDLYYASQVLGDVLAFTPETRHGETVEIDLSEVPHDSAEISIPEAVLTVDVETTRDQGTNWDNEHAVIVSCGGVEVFRREYTESLEAVFADEHVRDLAEAKSKALGELGLKFKKLLGESPDE